MGCISQMNSAENSFVYVISLVLPVSAQPATSYEPKLESDPSSGSFPRSSKPRSWGLRKDEEFSCEMQI